MADLAQAARWRTIANELQIEVIAPATLALPNGSRIEATALIRGFGGPNGMVVDPDYDVLAPHTEAILADGYGFSAVTIGQPYEDDAADFRAMLCDWGWCGEPDQKPNWI